MNMETEFFSPDQLRPSDNFIYPGGIPVPVLKEPKYKMIICQYKDGNKIQRVESKPIPICQEVKEEDYVKILCAEFSFVKDAVNHGIVLKPVMTTNFLIEQPDGSFVMNS